jgi:chemotaxis protein methyltransferase CheR
MEPMFNNIFRQEISPNDFRKLSDAIYKYSGIHLPEGKRNLVEGRIRKRIRLLELDSFSEYVDYLFSDEGLMNEFTPLIDVVTTNKTDFFRENAHFNFMTDVALPELERMNKEYCRINDIKIWSAGCSTGEEPYTMVIVLNEYSAKSRNFGFSVFASDISTEVLKTAAAGIYEYEKIEFIPDEMKRKYFLKSKNPEKNLIRVMPEFRAMVKFERINLIEESFPFSDIMDIVFCRNVLIYFDKPTQEKVIRFLLSRIRQGGFLFLGHSETTMGMKLPIERVASTIYRKK